MRDLTHPCMQHDSSMYVTWHIWCRSCHHVFRYMWMRVTRIIHTCDNIHSYVWHVSFICVTCLIHMCGMTDSHVWHNSFIRVTWLINICDIPRLECKARVDNCKDPRIFTFLAGKSSTTVPDFKVLPIYPGFSLLAWTHAYLWHEWLTCVTWLVHTCGMTA